jgi:hypothetical protein
LIRCTFFAASSAVVGVCLQVGTDAKAIAQSRGASAIAIYTAFATCAFIATVSAVVGVALLVATNSLATSLTCHAFEVASSAIVGV